MTYIDLYTIIITIVVFFICIIAEVKYGEK